MPTQNMDLYVSDGEAWNKVPTGGSWNNLADKPLTFPPTKHNHPEIDPKIYATDFLQYCTANGNAILDLSTVGRVEFDGDAGEGWTFSLSGANTALFVLGSIPNNGVISTDTNTLCNNLGFLQNNYYGTDSEGIFITVSNNLYFRLNKSKMTSWDDGWTNTQKITAFKTWLASNNLVVYYKLSGVTPSYTFADLKTSLNYFSSNNLWLPSSWDWADKTNMPDQTDALFDGLEDDFYPAGVYSFGGGTTQHTHLQYEPVITKGTTAQYFRGDMSLGTFPTQLPASDVSAWAKSSVKPTYNQDEVSDGTTYKRVTMAEKTNIVTAVTHAEAAHAPTDAQKNSDITKAEIEAKLTGLITTHEHAKLLQGATSNEVRFNTSTGHPEYFNAGSGFNYVIHHAGNLAAGTGSNNYCAGNDSRLSDARASTNHNLIDTTHHPVSGLTTGHVLKATSPTAYAFGPLTANDIGASPKLATIVSVADTTYNLSKDNVNSVIVMTPTAANRNLYILDYAENTYEVGSQITIINKGTQNIILTRTIDNGGTITINGSTSNTFTILPNYKAITLVCIASAVTPTPSSTWIAIGV